MTLTYREPMKVLADILVHELELDDIVVDNVELSPVMLYNERYKIPATYQGIYIVLSIVSSKVIGQVNRAENATDGLTEVQGITRNEMIQIDLMSANSDARTRRDEAVMALNSLYAQQQCELYNMKISRTPPQIVDLSMLEGSSRMNRYAITINAQSAYNRTKDAEYYDTFQNPPTVKVDN
jgi:hypothetical protein